MLEMAKRVGSCAAALLSVVSIAVADSAPSHVAAARSAAVATPSAWQHAERRAPGIVGQVVLLPAARALTPAELSAGAMSPQRRITGYVDPFDAALLPAWPWQKLSDGRDVAVVELSAPGACGLRVRIEEIDPAASIEMRFFDAAGATVYGPFVAPARDDAGGWWSPIVWSEVAGIELHARDGLIPGARLPRITKVAVLPHSLNCDWNAGPTLDCHNDVNCFSGWTDEANGVAVIHFVTGGLCSSCSAGLLNRQPADGSPLFMTANHCVSTQSEAASIEAFWFFESESCNGTAPTNPGLLPANLGATVLKRHSTSDWTLLGLYDPPASGATFLGWSSAAWSSNANATGIHHPQASFKRISFGETGGTSNQTFCGGGCIDADVRRVNFDDGTTEGGSSGSPVFDSDRQVRGTLTGGDDSCPDPTVEKYYGRLDLAYVNLRYYMGNSWIASPVHVNGAATGDGGGNNGNSEQGSAQAPFNAIREATYAVRSGDEIHITPGNYPQAQRIWRPMTLRRAGSTGVVTIGE